MDASLAVPGEPLKPGERRRVVVDGHEIAVFNVDGRVYAVGDRCPHRGGPLSRGRLEDVPGRGPAVRCPIHGWLFDLATGQSLNQPQAGTPVYGVTCEAQHLCFHPGESTKPRGIGAG